MSERTNHYDRFDVVHQESLILAGPMKAAAYRVRDPETGEYGPLQFHMTFDNTVMAVLGEQAAIFFASFVQQTTGRALPFGKPQAASPDSDAV